MNSPQPNSFYCELPKLGCLLVKGEKARTFLQGQTTCDITKLTAKVGLKGACCNNKGRVLATFVATPVNQTDVQLILPASIIPGLTAHLQKYALFHQVTLIDESEQYRIIASWGLTQETNPEGISVDDEIWTRLRKADGAIQETKVFGMATAVDASQWQLRRIQAGIPCLYPETVGLFTAHQLNLPGLGYVSFDKGCYTGQEIVARTHYRGKVKQGLHCHSLTTTQEGEQHKPGDKINIADQTAIIIERCCDPHDPKQTWVLALY